MYQAIYIIGCLLGIPFLPVLFIQGRSLKRKLPVLPEAVHNRTGCIGDGDALHLVTLGESTMAGVGVEDHRHGLTGAVAATLHALTGRKICWDVFANSGYSAEVVTKELIPAIPSRPVDLVVIALGANDAFELKSPKQWQNGITSIIKSLRNKNITCPVVIAAMPPLRYCPAFPILFKAIFGGLILLYSKTMKTVCRNNPRVYFMNEEINYKNWRPRIHQDITANDLFCDGVHPSELAYKLWGKDIGEFIVAHQLIKEVRAGVLGGSDSVQ